MLEIRHPLGHQPLKPGLDGDTPETARLHRGFPVVERADLVLRLHEAPVGVIKPDELRCGAPSGIARPGRPRGLARRAAQMRVRGKTLCAARRVAPQQGQARRRIALCPQPIAHPRMRRACQRRGAMPAKRGHQLLAQHEVDHIRTGQFGGPHPEGNQAEEDAVCAVGMDRGVDLVPRCHEMQHLAHIRRRTDLGDHAHIGVGAHEDHQRPGEIGAALLRRGPRRHRELHHPRADGGIFDRILDRVDRNMTVALLIEPLKMAHQRRGLAIAGRATEDHQPAVGAPLGGQRGEDILFQPEPGEITVASCAGLRQKPEVQKPLHIPLPGDLAPERTDAVGLAGQLP